MTSKRRDTEAHTGLSTPAPQGGQSSCSQLDEPEAEAMGGERPHPQILTGRRLDFILRAAAKRRASGSDLLFETEPSGEWIRKKKEGTERRRGEKATTEPQTSTAVAGSAECDGRAGERDGFRMRHR